MPETSSILSLKQTIDSSQIINRLIKDAHAILRQKFRQEKSALSNAANDWQQLYFCVCCATSLIVVKMVSLESAIGTSRVPPPSETDLRLFSS